MTREIKFRVWDGDEMVSPDYIDRSGTAWWKANSIPSMSKNIMQFTGLKDKNGKEIYEGDICKRNGHLRIIMFAHGSFMAYPTKDWQTEIDIDHLTAIHANWDLNNFISEIEVIGNIHENPELLTTKPY